jgi:hypothetical protein
LSSFFKAPSLERGVLSSVSSLAAKGGDNEIKAYATYMYCSMHV